MTRKDHSSWNTDLNTLLLRRSRTLPKALVALSLTAGVVLQASAFTSADPIAHVDSDGTTTDTESDQLLQSRNHTVNQLAAINNEIDTLGLHIQEKQQLANKAIEDLHAARRAMEEAGNASLAAEDELRGAHAHAASTQKRAEELIAFLYTNESAMSPSLSVWESPNIHTGLDRAATLEMFAQHEMSLLNAAKLARENEAQRTVSLHEAQESAEQMLATAEQAKARADEAVKEAVTASDNARAQRENLVRERDKKQQELESALGRSTPAERNKNSPSTGAPVLSNSAPDQREEKKNSPDAASLHKDGRGGNSVPESEDIGQQLARQVAALDPDLSHLIMFGATPAAAAAPAPSGGGYVPRLYGQQAVETVIRRGLTQIGRIYSWGGGSAYGPTKGIHDGGVADRYGDYMISGYDCSGLMIYAFAGAGILLPHYTGYQYRAGKHVPAAQMRRGDLIFYGPNASQHVTLYLGNGWMLESPQSGERVKVSRLRTGGMTPDVVRFF